MPPGRSAAWAALDFLAVENGGCFQGKENTAHLVPVHQGGRRFCTHGKRGGFLSRGDRVLVGVGVWFTNTPLPVSNPSIPATTTTVPRTIPTQRGGWPRPPPAADAEGGPHRRPAEAGEGEAAPGRGGGVVITGL